jgi:hypothetical protein
MSRYILACALLLAAGAHADPITVTVGPAPPSPVPPPSSSSTAPGPVASAVPAATHALAVAANTAGFRFHRAGQIPRGAMRFRDAVLLDPEYSLAHFNLACAASRLRDVATTVTEMTWLAQATDPVAVAKMQKALVDPDLDFASALPKVRTILDLAPYDAQRPLAWLAERHGTWSAEVPTDDCSSRSYSFVFEADGAAHLIVREACGRRGLPVVHTYDGTTVLASGGGVKVDIRGWPLWPAGIKLAFGACPGLTDAPGSCFVLLDGDDEVGPFHRGLPGTSPMRGRADVAALK